METDKKKPKEELLKEVFEITKNVKVDMKILEKQAKEHPDRMLFQNVKNPDEHQERYFALYYSMQGDYAESIEHANKGLKINPKSAFLLYLRGRSKGDIRQLAEGINDLTEAIKIEPNYAEAFVERGYIEQKMGDFSAARADYEKGIRLDLRLDPSLQQQVNTYLDKNNLKEDMVIPSGVTFKFIVTPSISNYHQEGIKYFIINKSELSQYFKNIYVTFYDGCYVDNQGTSFSDDKLKGKQMLAKVFCPESNVAIAKSKEEYFYQQVKEKYSEWIIDMIQSNAETKYSAKLEAFHYTNPML